MVKLKTPPGVLGKFAGCAIPRSVARYELRAGTKQRFWEVDVEGKILCVRWGRIGTKGRSQEKKLSKPEAAQAEADRLIQQKTRKGYWPVDGDPSPTTAASPEEGSNETTPAEVSPRRIASADPPESLTPHFTEDFGPTRNWSWPSVVDKNRRWGKLRKLCDQLRREADDAPADTAPKLRTTIELLEGPAPATLPIDLVAMMLSWHADYGVSLATGWLSREDAPRAVLAAGRYTKGPGPKHRYTMLLEWQNPKAPYFNAYGQIGPLLMASEAVDSLDQAQLDALVRDVEAAWEGWPTIQRVRAAAVLRRVPRLLERVLDESKQYGADHVLALLAVSDAAAGLRLASGWKGGAAPVVDAILLERLGPAVASEVLAAFGGRVNGEGKEELLSHLREIRSVAAAKFFVGLLEDRRCKRDARELLEAAPAYAIAALHGVRRPVARGLFDVLVAREPELAAEVLAFVGNPGGKGADESGGLESGGADAGAAAPVARDTKLPAILRTPPWAERQTSPRAKTEALTLAPISMRECYEWEDGQRAEWREGSPVPRKADGIERAEKLIAAAKRAYKKKGATLHVGVLLYPSAASATTRLWNALPPELIKRAPQDCVRALIARMQHRGIPGYLGLATRKPAIVATLLVGLRSPRLAPFYAEVLSRSSKSRVYAQQWLLRFPEEAAVGLVPGAVGEDDRAAKRAVGALLYLVSKGHADAVDAAARRYGAEAQAAVRARLGDARAAKIARRPAIPNFATVATLPPVWLRDRSGVLAKASVSDLIGLLAASPLDPPHPGLGEIRDACAPETLSAFVWALFERWLGAGADGAHGWVLDGLAHFGGDPAARKLSPLVRRWPGESAHGRAARGLQVLEAMGTDLALMFLHSIGQSSRYEALRRGAEEAVARVAERRGLDADALADRLVPDLGLDANGTATFVVGDDTFTVRFDEAVRPELVDETGRVRKRLPKAKAGDSSGAEAAIRWKAFRSDARTFVPQQLRRLEHLMCSDRRIPYDEFQRLYVAQALRGHLVRRLAWASYTAAGKLDTLFFVNAEGVALRADGAPCAFEKDCPIGLPHPVNVPAARRNAMAERFDADGIVQPFEQLGRATYSTLDALRRFEGIRLPLERLARLERLGWRKGPPQDAGIVYEMHKPIPKTPSILSVGVRPGFTLGSKKLPEMATQTFDAPRLVGTSPHGVPFRELQISGSEALAFLTPVVLSEAVRDLTLATEAEATSS